MADPTPYAPSFDFTPIDRGENLNVELANVQAAIAGVIDAIQDLRRSDGSLQNGVVTSDALSVDIIATLLPQEAAFVATAEAAAVSATGSAGAAAGSAEAAGLSAVAAAGSATSASGAANSASAAFSAAQTARVAAEAARVLAETAQGAAETAVVDAGAAGTAAGTVAGAAAGTDAAEDYLAASRICFSAHKNGAAQGSIVTATPTAITFGTEDFDVGGYYDVATSRWTPPAGKYRVSAALAWSAGLVDARQVTCEIWKNGAVHRVFGVQVSGTTDSALVSGSCLVSADGDDFFEVYGTGFGAGNKTVSGEATLTFFQGEAI